MKFTGNSGTGGGDMAVKASQLQIVNTSDLQPDYLPDFFVWWDAITSAQVREFRAAVEAAKRESDMQRYLETNPLLLIQHMGGGHGRWVIPQKRLGAEYVPDFVVGARDSLGFHWQAIEIESTHARLFTKRGDPTAPLSHAIRQILDWRSWLKRNQDYAARSADANGLGLVDIDSTVPGIIIIGRRASVDDRTRELRRQLSTDLGVEIHTYDWMSESAEGRLRALRRSERSKKT